MSAVLRQRGIQNEEWAEAASRQHGERKVRMEMKKGLKGCIMGTWK
jgi:hypothetical protein